MLKIYTVLCRAGTMDNYAYILVDEDTRTTAVVDLPKRADYCQTKRIETHP